MRKWNGRKGNLLISKFEISAGTVHKIKKETGRVFFHAVFSSFLFCSFSTVAQELPSLPQAQPSSVPNPTPSVSASTPSGISMALDESKSKMPTKKSKVLKKNKMNHKKTSDKGTEDKSVPSAVPAENVPHGQELVSIDFPNGVNLSDIIKTIGVWTGKNFILGQGVSGNSKISIISQELVTKEEAYQAFLSALNISGFTTVETGKIVKILPISNAKSSNIKTYYGETWAPATDEVINHVVPLQYIDVKLVVEQLRPLLGMTQYAPFTTTNSLILTDTGNRIRRILEVIKLLDNKTSQSQVSIVPINYSDAKEISNKILEIFGNKGGTNISLQKALVDERTNSIILVGPAHTLDDIVRFIQKIDKPSQNESAQTLIHVRALDYADSEKLAQTLQALSQNTNANSGNKTQGNTSFQNGARPPYLPPIANNVPNSSQQSKEASAANLNGIKVTADKATNSLIIQGTNSAFNELDLIIAQLDKRRAQVYIESTILDLDVQNDFNWSPSVLGGVSGENGVAPFGFNASGASPFLTSNGLSGGLPQGALSSAILGVFSNRSVVIGGMSLSPGALIFALKTDTSGDVLQTPSMMVSDNETANFESSQTYSVITNAANPNGSGTVNQVQTYPVVTSLQVTPQISRSDYVNLKIALQLDNAGQPDPKTGYPNPITKRKADSFVTVQNGQTAVMGGLTQSTMKVSENKVPVLGDVPIVGWLFKNESRTKVKSNLTLFVTPHVVRNADDLAKIYERKIKERDEFLKAFYGSHFKDEEQYAAYPQAGDGAARFPTIYEEENKPKKKFDGLEDMQQKSLPSLDRNPINAPSAGGAVGGGGYTPAPPANIQNSAPESYGNSGPSMPPPSNPEQTQLPIMQ
jgi:general secretion pathway protein D